MNTNTTRKRMISCFAQIMTDMGGAIDAPDYAYIKFLSRAVCSYSRFVAFVRAVTWLKKDIIQSLWFYGMEREKNSSVSSHFRAEDKTHDQNHATLQNSLIHK